MKKVTIYCLYNNKGEVYYVGSSINPEVRLKDHKSSGVHPNVKGMIKLELTLEFLRTLREQHWIDELKSKGINLKNKTKVKRLKKKRVQ